MISSRISVVKFCSYERPVYIASGYTMWAMMASLLQDSLIVCHARKFLSSTSVHDLYVDGASSLMICTSMCFSSWRKSADAVRYISNCVMTLGLCMNSQYLWGRCALHDCLHFCKYYSTACTAAVSGRLCHFVKVFCESNLCRRLQSYVHVDRDSALPVPIKEECVSATPCVYLNWCSCIETTHNGNAQSIEHLRRRSGSPA